MQTQLTQRARWDTSMGFKEITTLFYVWYNMERKTIPCLLPLIMILTPPGNRKKQLPQATPRKKNTHTHQTQLEDLQHTHSWAVILLRLFLPAHWPDYCLFLFDGWVTATGFLSTEHRSHLHLTLLVTHWKSPESLDTSCQVKEKAYKGFVTNYLKTEKLG